MLLPKILHLLHWRVEKTNPQSEELRIDNREL